MNRPIRVLYVDQDGDLSMETAATLDRDYGQIEILEETNANAALDRVHSADSNIDCIVSGYELSGMNGVEFLKAVRDTHKKIPFILFIAEGSEAIASDAISAGVTEYTRKQPDTTQSSMLADRIQTAVLQSRAHTDHRGIFDEIPDGVVIHEVDSGEIVEANQTFCAMLDYDYADLQSMCIDDVVTVEQGATFTEADGGSEASSRHQVSEWLTDSASGDSFRCEVHRVGISYQGRDCELAITRDISIRDERDHHLRQEKAFVESLFDAIPDVLYAIDTAGNLMRWNDRVTEVTGYTDAELAEMASADFFEGEDLERIMDAIETVITERRSKTVEAHVVTKEGDEIPYEFVGAPLTDDTGDLRGIIGAARDITARQTRQHELERYEQIIETVGDAVFELDGQGYFIEVNDYTAEILGYDTEDLIGEHLTTVISPNDLEEAQKHHQKLLTGEEEYVTFEVMSLTADGDQIPCEVRSALAPQRPGSDRRGSVGIVRDITDRKTRERELHRQNERLEEFASIVSHDLKTPLSVVEGRIQLAQSACESTDLDIAVDTLNRMEALIDRTLTLARKGQAVGETHPTSLQDVAEDSWRNAGGPHAALQVESLPVIMADPDRLRHLFENLFGNALEHGTPDEFSPTSDSIREDGQAATPPTSDPEGSRESRDDSPSVTITVGRLDEGFYVADDGPGIPEDYRDDVLESGFTTSEEGSGLGLAIVRQIAEAHGWEINVTTSEAGGACFEFTNVDRSE